MKDRCMGCRETKEIEDHGIINKGEEPRGYCIECIERIKRMKLSNQDVLCNKWFDPPRFWKNIQRLRKCDIAMRRA
jgi:hypothetical protein